MPFVPFAAKPLRFVTHPTTQICYPIMTVNLYAKKVEERTPRHHNDHNDRGILLVDFSSHHAPSALVACKSDGGLRRRMWQCESRSYGVGDTSDGGDDNECGRSDDGGDSESDECCLVVIVAFAVV